MPGSIFPMIAQRDLVRSWFCLSPHKIPLFGRSHTTAIMTDDEGWEYLEQVAPDGFINEVAARIAIRADKYHPINAIPKVQCPVLLQVGEKDISLPGSVIEKAERRLAGRGQVIRYPVGHFGIYLGEIFEQAVADQVRFFSRHLLS